MWTEYVFVLVFVFFCCFFVRNNESIFRFIKFDSENEISISEYLMWILDVMILNYGKAVMGGLKFIQFHIRLDLTELKGTVGP